MDVKELQHIIESMPEREAKGYLLYILASFASMKDRDTTSEMFFGSINDLYKDILRPSTFQKNLHHKVHICSGHGSTLRQLLKIAGKRDEEYVIAFNDNFAIGPIKELAGIDTRVEWLRDKLKMTESDLFDYHESFLKALDEITALPTGVPITIWAADNAHEQTGLLFSLSLIGGKENPVLIMNPTHHYRELFRQKAKKYLPIATDYFLPEELSEIEKAAVLLPLSNSERDAYAEQWVKFAGQNLRIWADGSITPVPDDYFDETIVTFAKKLTGKKNRFIKSARVIGEVYGRLDHYIGDEYLEYRVRSLIEKGVFDYEGSLEAMRLYSIKMKTE